MRSKISTQRQGIASFKMRAVLISTRGTPSPTVDWSVQSRDQRKSSSVCPGTFQGWDLLANLLAYSLTNFAQGENMITCDPWTARDFIAHMGEETRNCPQCRSDCELTTYSNTVTSTEFRFFKKKPWVFEHQGTLLRTCDSRNLNLSPFCNLTAQSLVKWQPAVNSTYDNITTNYTSRLEGPMRLKYPGEGKSNKEGELITILTEVVFLF